MFKINIRTTITSFKDLLEKFSVSHPDDSRAASDERDSMGG